jgi:ribose transport system substrate-binding protein
LACLLGCAGSEPEPGPDREATGQPPAPGPAAGPTLALIPKGTTHLFWKAVEAGAREAAAELEVELIWKGPLQESDRAGQIQLVQQFVSQGVDAIGLAPLDHVALVAPVRQAAEKGIPVVIFDSALQGEAGRDFVSFVATDNLAGGRLAGAHLGELLAGQGRVVLLRYVVGSASTTRREEGFLEAVGEAGSVEVLVDNRYAGPTAGEAKTESLNMIDTIEEADGVFCPNESATYGMLLALRQAGLAGKVRFVGFDASPPLVEALREGEIDALVVQDPRKMGRLTVETLAHHLQGREVEGVVDTGAVLVTRENLGDPEIARLLE